MGVLATSSAFICLTDTIWSSFSGSAGYVSSAYFNVNNVPAVVVTAPSEGTVLFQGNVSTAKWIYDPNQVLSTTPVIVQLWISVDLAPDTAVSSPGSFLMSSGAAGLSFTLPPNALASSKYYWLISWGTYSTFFGYPFTSQSGYFSVIAAASQAQITITAPIKNSQFSTGQTMTVVWFPSALVTAPVYVELMQVFCFEFLFSLLLITF